MVGTLCTPPTQAVRMIFAWIGALVVLAVSYHTAGAVVLANPLHRLPILGSLIVTVMLSLRQVFTRAQPVWLSFPICAVLGALFTLISVSLTMLCAGIFA